MDRHSWLDCITSRGDVERCAVHILAHFLYLKSLENAPDTDCQFSIFFRSPLDAIICLNCSSVGCRPLNKLTAIHAAFLGNSVHGLISFGWLGFRNFRLDLKDAQAFGVGRKTIILDRLRGGCGFTFESQFSASKPLSHICPASLLTKSKQQIKMSFSPPAPEEKKNHSVTQKTIIQYTIIKENSRTITKDKTAKEMNNLQSFSMLNLVDRYYKSVSKILYY